MAYKGQPFQRGLPPHLLRSQVRKKRSAASERQLCRTRGQRYETEEAAAKALGDLEKAKINPGSLKVFRCGHCEGFHLGTAFGGSPRSYAPDGSRRRPRQP